MGTGKEMVDGPSYVVFSNTANRFKLEHKKATDRRQEHAAVSSHCRPSIAFYNIFSLKSDIV